jgi:hypothetical protein
VVRQGDVLAVHLQFHTRSVMEGFSGAVRPQPS